MSDQENDPQLLQEVEDDVQRRQESRESNDRLLAMPVYVEKPEVVVELPDRPTIDELLESMGKPQLADWKKRVEAVAETDVERAKELAINYLKNDHDLENAPLNAAQEGLAINPYNPPVADDGITQEEQRILDKQAAEISRRREEASIIADVVVARIREDGSFAAKRKLDDLKSQVRFYAEELQATLGDWTPKDVISNLYALADGESQLPTVLEAKRSLFLAGL